MKLFLTIIGMVLVLFVITFSLANIDPVHLKYYHLFDFQIPAYLLIFITFGLGVVFTGMLDVLERGRLSRQVRKLKKRIAVYEKAEAMKGPAGDLPEEEPKREEEPPEEERPAV
jgi:uncharacterized integral membrane protein